MAKLNIKGQGCVLLLWITEQESHIPQIMRQIPIAIPWVLLSYNQDTTQTKKQERNEMTT